MCPAPLVTFAIALILHTAPWGYHVLYHHQPDHDPFPFCLLFFFFFAKFTRQIFSHVSA
ncbi:hypothetical protein EDB87DRAFT_1640743 [Lactarius vividus]|nr:hypothetical protein EDB87DRAFT_1640743 [Lactarius vividus]